MCLGSLPLDELQRLADAGARWLTEMENIDTAYGIRRLGLMARLALRAGDFEHTRESVLAGAALAERMPFCSFWAHEGFSALGDSLLALRRRERERGGALPPLDLAWTRLDAAVGRHVRRFPAGQALWPRLRGQHALDEGRTAAGVRLLNQAVQQAERQGLRVELARACESLEHAGAGAGAAGAASGAGADWGGRAQRLWQDMGRAQLAS